jgi:hypothetical protein
MRAHVIPFYTSTGPFSRGLFAYNHVAAGFERSTPECGYAEEPFHMNYLVGRHCGHEESLKTELL